MTTVNNAEAVKAIEDLGKKLAKPKRRMVNIPFDPPDDMVVMFHALKSLAVKGCSRLVPPSTCRQSNGYPRAEWCEGCIAAAGLGLDEDWFQLR